MGAAAPIIAAGITAAAGVAGDAVSAVEQERTNAENFAEAQRNRDFQERMSDTAYQRGVADMKKAGINPILAAGQGGASSPAGTTIAANNPGSAFSNMGSIASSAIDAMRTTASLKQMDLQNTKTEREISGIEQDNARKFAENAPSGGTDDDGTSPTNIVGWERRLAKAQLANLIAQANNSAARTKLTAAEIPSQLIQTKMNTSTYGQFLEWMRRTQQGLGGTAQGIANGIGEMIP